MAANRRWRWNVACRAALSMWCCVVACATAAHELRPAVADVAVERSSVTVELRLPLEPLVAGMDLAALSDTDESPLSGLHDRLRAMPPTEFAEAVRTAWPGIAERLELRAGGARLTPEISALTVPEVGDVELPRDSRLVLRADLPPGGAPVQVGWAATYGPIVVRQATGSDTPYSAMLTDGALSAPLPRPAAPIWIWLAAAGAVAVAASGALMWRRRAG